MPGTPRKPVSNWTSKGKLLRQRSAWRTRFLVGSSICRADRPCHRAPRGAWSRLRVRVGRSGRGRSAGAPRREHGGRLVRGDPALGRRALPLQMDMTRRARSRAVVEANRHFGRMNILVNNAGIGPPNPAVEVTEETST